MGGSISGEGASRGDANHNIHVGYR